MLKSCPVYFTIVKEVANEQVKAVTFFRALHKMLARSGKSDRFSSQDNEKVAQSESLQ